MAHPYLSEKNFNAGTNAEWDSETDTESKLNVYDYKYLARNYPGVMPYRGAYAPVINLSLGAADAMLAETGDFDTALSGTIHVKFYVYFVNDFTMANADRFTIFALDSAGPVNEVVVDVRYTTAAGYQILASETSASATVRAATLEFGKWHCVELACAISSGAADGTVDFYLDGYQVSTQLGSLTQAAISQARYGAFNIDATTTTGTVLLGPIWADNARMYPDA